MDVLEPRNQEAEPEGEDEEEEGEEEEVDERGGIHEKVRSFPSYEQPRTLNDELKAKADSKIDEEKRESAPPVALRLKGELRLKTRRLKYQGLTSKHVGVHVSKGRWRANIWWKMKSIHLGYCATEAEAGRLYDSAAYYLRGAEAQPNFPDEQPRPLSDELKAKIDAVKRLEKSSVDDGNGKVEEIEQESDDEKDQSKKKGRSKVPRSNAAPTSVAIDSRLLQARQGPAIPAASSVEEMGYERFTSAIDQWVDMLRP